MPATGLPAIVLLIEGLVFASVGIRETATGSWLGALLAWSLAFLAFLNAGTIQRRRQ